MKLVICLFVISYFCVSCKKDKLTDDKEIFVGKWNWFNTIAKIDLCNPPGYEDLLNPQITGENYTIQFLDKGKVLFYKNDVEIESYRIVFTLFGGNGCDYLDGYSYYGIDLDNNEELDLDGCISEDTLIVIRGFPFHDPQDACQDYTSYFVKQ